MNILESDCDCSECGKHGMWEELQVSTQTLYRLPSGWYMDRWCDLLCDVCVANRIKSLKL